MKIRNDNDKVSTFVEYILIGFGVFVVAILVIIASIIIAVYMAIEQSARFLALKSKIWELSPEDELRIRRFN